MKDVNVLFIGSFSPIHDGHVYLIDQYAKENNVNVIISKLPREGISSKSTYDFFKKIFKNNKKIEIEISEENSPMTYAINKVINAKTGTYALASSTKKGDEDRSIDFKNKFKDKKLNKGVNVVKLNIDSTPLKFYNRNDQFNDKPISSRIIRNDIRKNDFENFIKGYEYIMKNHNISSDDIKKYYEILQKEILPVKESILNDELLENKILSQNKNIFDNASIMDSESKILDNAEIHDYVTIANKTIINDNAKIYGSVHVKNSKICGNSYITGANIKQGYSTTIIDNSDIYDNSFIDSRGSYIENIIMYNNAKIYGNVCLGSRHKGKMILFGNCILFNRTELIHAMNAIFKICGKARLKNIKIFK